MIYRCRLPESHVGPSGGGGGGGVGAGNGAGVGSELFEKFQRQKLNKENGQNGNASFNER